MSKFTSLMTLLCSLLAVFPIQAQDCADGLFERGNVLVVNPGAAQNVREEPSTDAAVTQAVPAGEYQTVWGGPTCAEGYTWWLVEYDRQTGWTAEAPADGGAAWLSKVEMPLFEQGNVRLEMSSDVGSTLGYRDYDTNHGDGFDYPAHRLFTLEATPPVYPASPYQGYWNAIPPQGGILIAPRTDVVNERPEIDVLQSLLDRHFLSEGTFMAFVPASGAETRPQLAYLPLLTGVGQRWIGYPDPAGFKGDRYVPVPENFKYYLQGLSGDGQYYVAALFPIAVNIEMPVFPDLPTDRRLANEAYEQYLQTVNDTLDTLPPNAFLPRLSLLDAMMRSLTITQPIELQTSEG